MKFSVVLNHTNGRFAGNSWRTFYDYYHLHCCNNRLMLTRARGSKNVTVEFAYSECGARVLNCKPLQQCYRMNITINIPRAAQLSFWYTFTASHDVLPIVIFCSCRFFVFINTVYFNFFIRFSFYPYFSSLLLFLYFFFFIVRIKYLGPPSFRAHNIFL